MNADSVFVSVFGTIATIAFIFGCYAAYKFLMTAPDWALWSLGMGIGFASARGIVEGLTD